MTKYFLVNNASRAAVYGIGTYVRQLAECIRGGRLQYELCILDIHSDEKEFTVEEDERGIPHYKIPSLPDGGKSFPYYRYILFLLESYVREEDDVVFHFNFGQHFDLVRLLKAKYRYCRILYTVHYFNWCFTLNGNVTRFRKIINKEVEDAEKKNIQGDFYRDKRLFSLCDEVIALSKFAYELLQVDYSISKSKLHLVYNGMTQNPNMVQHCSGNVLNQEILFVGRLDEIKGIGYIIQAFKQILTCRENVHLTLVGDGDFSRYLKLCDGIWDKVTFTGKLSVEQLEKFFCQATIGVQPSFHEQCSYSAIEMMAHGIPFVATDSTGLSEMMDYTPECLIHIDEDNFQEAEFVEQLASKMEILLSNSQVRAQVSEKLLQLFHERYNMNCMRNAMENILCQNEKKGYSISNDFLPYLDDEFVRLVNATPVLDMDYVGLTGIGCYLWWRIETLKSQTNKKDILRSSKIQEHLIYYIDWLSDVLDEDGLEAFSPSFESTPLIWLLRSLRDAGFYKTKVDSVIRKIHSLGADIYTDHITVFDNSMISRTALKIYNLNL